MVNKNIIIIADYSEEKPLSFEEVCESCGISADYVYELIEYEIVRPATLAQEEMLFEVEQLRRIKTALRLKHELEVNMQGIAIILDLLEEMEALRAEKELLKKHLLSE